MKNYFYLASVFILATLWGCQNEEDVFDNTLKQTNLVVTAFLEGNADSRTALENGKLYWSENDELSVFLGLAEGKNQEFELIDGAGTKSGSFQGKNGQIIIGSTEAGNYTWSNVAYYPYDKNITIKKDDSSYKLDVTLPTIQNYARDSYGQNAYPMVAVTENKNDYEFIFKNFMSIVTLSLKGNATITKVVLKSESKPLAGAAIVEATTGKADIDFVEGGDVSSIVVLDCGDGVTINENSYTVFTLVMPPGTYPAKDLTLTVYDNQNRFQSYNVTGEFIINPNQTRNTNRSFDAPQEVVKVKLNGAGSYADIAAAVSAITDKTVQNTITLAAGTYTLPTSLSGLNLVIEGENADLPEEVVLDMSQVGQPQYGAENVTFKNLTMKRSTSTYNGLSHTKSEQYDNCIIEGMLETYGTLKVTNSKFVPASTDGYNVHIYSAGSSSFENCTFTAYKGRSVYAHADNSAIEMNITFKNCSFVSANGKNENNFATAIRLHTESDFNGGCDGIYGTLTIENCTIDNNFNTDYNGGLWVEWNNLTREITYNFTKKVDNVNPDGFEKVAENEYNIFNANGLVYAAKNLFPNGGTFNIISDINMTDVEYPSVDYNIDEEFIIKGNKNTIKGMSMPLINTTWSAGKLVKIQDLTLENPAVALDVEDTKGTIPVGAFIASPGASTNIKLNNCHVLGGSVKGGHWTGGLVGWAGGYNGTDGPVFETLTIVDCSVKNCTIEGKGSVGGIIGHAANCAWTLVDMDDITVSGNTITSTGDSDVKAGSVMGTVGAAQTYTVNGITHDGYVSVDNAIIENNTVTSNGTTIDRIYGRQGSPGGVLYIDGVQVIFESNQLETALHKDVAEIKVQLAADVAVDITAWETLAFGGATTSLITIDGNNHTLTFNKLNGDWNNVSTIDAKLVLKNMTITDSGKNDGPWNRYDINFECDVELENVVSKKAIATKANASLKNVTVEETGDNYGLWIQPHGQTVSIEGCTFNVENGRGIKIDDQYVDAPAKVTLKVSNANFTAAKKAAILVKSAAGADITLSNVNINNVAADKDNAVWVDEVVTKPQIDGKVNPCYGSYGLVTVTGGNLVLEGTTKLTEGVLSNEDAKAYYIVNAAGLNWLTSEVNTNNKNFKGETVNLLVDIDLAGAVQTRIGQYKATSFEGTFDGMSHTISNFKVTASDAEKNGNYATAFFGRATTATVIKGLTLDKATIEGHHWTAALVGYNHGKVENCHVTNSVINCSHVSADACGDKAGAIAGICADSAGKLIGCSATDCTVKGVRDVGQLVGAAATSCVDSACKATNVKVGVHKSFVDCTDGSAGMNISSNSLIGRIL